MLPLSAQVIETKNQLATTEAFVLMLEAVIPGQTETLRVVANDEDLVWRTYTWQKFPFEIDEITDDGGGEVPEITIRVSNASRVMETYLLEYDAYLKTNGLAKIQVSLYVVNTSDLANTDPVVEFHLDVASWSADAQWATFVLAFENFYVKRFPRNRLLRVCRWQFGSTQCGVTPGPGQTCNKTLTDCRSYSNSPRFGGFPSVGGRLSKVYT